MSSSRTPLTGTIFVFVHGAWHSSWQWAATQRWLARLGAASLALDLPGHGFDARLPRGYLEPGQPGLETAKSELAGVTMDECASEIAGTLRAVRSYREVVLVAHSAGGGPVSAAAEQSPDLVDRLVYLSAFVPAGRPRFADYLSTPEQTDNALGAGLIVGDPEVIGAFRINPASPDPAYIDELRQTHYHDIPAGAFDRWRLALSPDLPVSIPVTPVTLTRERWGSIPRSFIRCADDRAAAPAMQDLMISEADEAMPDRPFTVRTLPGSHAPFAARPAELAAALVAAL